MYMHDYNMTEIEGLLVQDSPEALRCDLEEDSLSSTKYWSNLKKTGNCPDITEKLLPRT